MTILYYLIYFSNKINYEPIRTVCVIIEKENSINLTFMIHDGK